VKCDEARPLCHRCVRGGWACGGYTHTIPKVELSSKELIFVNYAAEPLSRINLQPDLNWKERRALSFFQNWTSLELGGPFSSDLWTTFVLRMASSESAVRSAVIALASMHQSFLNLDIPAYNELHDFAMQNYCRSIRKVIGLNERLAQHASVIALVTSVLFAAIESLQGHLNSSMGHVMSGMKIIQEYDDNYELDEDRKGNHAPVPVDLLRPIFISIGTQIMAITRAPWAGLSWLDSQTRKRPFKSAFVTTEEALVEMSILTKDLTRLSTHARLFWNDTNYPDQELQWQRDSLRLRLKDWTAAFELMVNARTSRSSSASMDKAPAITSLRVNHSIAKVLLETSLNKDQMCFDEYLGDFQNAVTDAEKFLQLTDSGPQGGNGSTAERPTFSLPMGIVPSLYIVCSRCRDPLIRHRALQLLKSCRRREGVWDSYLVSRAAEQFINIEESLAMRYWQAQKQGGASNKRHSPSPAEELLARGQGVHPRSSSDIPPCCRLAKLDTTFPEEKRADLTYVSTGGERENDVIYWDR
jgi:hypothetical protein